MQRDSASRALVPIKNVRTLSCQRRSNCQLICADSPSCSTPSVDSASESTSSVARIPHSSGMPTESEFPSCLPPLWDRRPMPAIRTSWLIVTRSFDGSCYLAGDQTTTSSKSAPTAQPPETSNRPRWNPHKCWARSLDCQQTNREQREKSAEIAPKSGGSAKERSTDQRTEPSKYKGSRGGSGRTREWFAGERLVARDGIEPPTRGFSDLIANPTSPIRAKERCNLLTDGDCAAEVGTTGG